MEQEKYLFDPLVGDDVILNYSLDVFKLLIEDKEWSESIIMSLDANDFNLYDFRFLIGNLQNHYFMFKNIPDYDILLCDLFSHYDLSDIDKELYSTYCTKCEEKVLSEDRIKQIKSSLPYWSIFVLIAKIGNMCLDTSRDGYKTEQSIMQRAGNVINMSAKLKMLIDNPNISPHTAEGWV